MSERHWLWRFTRPEFASPPWGRPHLVERDGAVWSVVTDGRVIIYLAGNADNFEQPPQPFAERLMMFFEPVGTRTGFYLNELKAFLGEPIWPVPCAPSSC